MDNRKYRRIASGVHVDFHLARADAATRDYYSGLIENYSFGGLFIASEVSMSVGDVVYLNIEPEGEAPFTARALVRWTRRWKRPRGAGIEFIEFDGLGDREVADVLRRLFESDDSPAANDA